MKIFFAVLLSALAVFMVALIISSAKACKKQSKGFVDFLISWIFDADECFAILFLCVMVILILIAETK